MSVSLSDQLLDRLQRHTHVEDLLAVSLALFDDPQKAGDVLPPSSAELAGWLADVEGWVVAPGTTPRIGAQMRTR